jgi:hypothetical protein
MPRFEGLPLGTEPAADPAATAPQFPGTLTNDVPANNVPANNVPADNAPAPRFSGTPVSDAPTPAEGAGVNGIFTPDITAADSRYAGLLNVKPEVDRVLDGPKSLMVGQAAALGRGIVAVSNVGKAAKDAVAMLFEPDLGMSKENLALFTNQTPEDFASLSPLALARTFNGMTLPAITATLDVGMRAALAPVLAGAVAVGQVAQELGMSDGDAHRLTRDILMIVDMAGIAFGTAPAQTLSTFRMAAREKVLAAADTLPAADRLAAAQRMAAALDEGTVVAAREAGDAANLPPIREFGPVPEAPVTRAAGETVAATPDGMPRVEPGLAADVPLTEPRIAQPVSMNVINAASELLVAGKVQRAEGRLISDQVMELLQTKRLTTEEIGAILTKNNLTPDDFADLWRTNIRKAAQDMQALSAIEQRLKALNKQPGAEGELAVLQEAAGMGANERTLNWWQRVDNVRRGLLVTQLATAARNFETQMGRIGFDTLQQGLDAGLRRVFSPVDVRETHPIDAFGSFVGVMRPFKTKEQVDSILGAFPKEQDRLYGNWMSEFQGGMFGAADKAVGALNIVNRTQEYVVRRAVFQSRLGIELEARGLSLEDIVNRNAVGAIPREAIEAAVDHSLEMTFGKSFSQTASGAEGLAGSFIKLVNGLPGATFVIPFPRFLMNAVKFQYEWSPLGYLRLLSGAERAKIAAGDMSAISRATIGTGVLAVAFQFRDSEYAGEKWYEAKLPDGQIIDLRPFNPFASYLFLADIAKRKRDGTLTSLTAKDIVTGVLATQMRAGTGAFILDTALEGIAGLDASEKGVRAIQDLAGNVLSGFTVPINTITDFLGEFSDAAKVVRSGNEGPVVGPVNFGPVLRNIPGLKDELPAVRSPLRGGELTRESGARRQLTGLSIDKAKNAVETEVDRLGITRSEYFPSSGDPRLDRLVATQMGPVVEQALPQLVTSDAYRTFTPAVQAFILVEALKGVRDMAKDAAAAQEPALAARLKLSGIPDRKRAAINALTDGSIDKAVEMLRGMERPLRPD